MDCCLSFLVHRNDVLAVCSFIQSRIHDRDQSHQSTRSEIPPRSSLPPFQRSSDRLLLCHFLRGQKKGGRRINGLRGESPLHNQDSVHVSTKIVIFEPYCRNRYTLDLRSIEQPSSSHEGKNLLPMTSVIWSHGITRN